MITILDVYRTYLSYRGKVTGKFTGRGSLNSLSNRNDKKLFEYVTIKVNNAGIDDKMKFKSYCLYVVKIAGVS